MYGIMDWVLSWVMRPCLSSSRLRNHISPGCHSQTSQIFWQTVFRKCPYHCALSAHATEFVACPFPGIVFLTQLPMLVKVATGGPDPTPNFIGWGGLLCEWLLIPEISFQVEHRFGRENQLKLIPIVPGTPIVCSYIPVSNWKWSTVRY